MTGKKLHYRRDIDIRHEVDVLVAGGGPAGLSAAVAAARQGRSVRLVEAHSSMGGMGTAGMVPVFMPFTDGINFLAGGIGREVLDRLRAAGGTYPADGVAIKAEVLKRLYEDLLEEAGVSFSYHTRVVDTTASGGTVDAAVCAAKSGMFAIQARAFVDCTGDGDLAVSAGAQYEMGDAEGRTMPATLCSLWSRIDWKAVDASRSQSGDDRRMEEAIQDGLFSAPDRHLPGMWRVGETLGGGNIGHAFDVDGTDEESLTRAYVRSRRLLREYQRYYKEYLKGFEQMELAGTASLMGIRESRRITGDYVLNQEDFRNLSSFEDEIGRFNYWIDIHIARPDKASFDEHVKLRSTTRLKAGESYGIPYRVLTPKGLKNVLVAGRCISTDRAMQASVRVMPCCYITGQAAGIAAALMAEGKAVQSPALGAVQLPLGRQPRGARRESAPGADSRSIRIGELQRRLKAIGAYLPNWRGELP